MDTLSGLLINQSHFEMMRNDVRAKGPEEACGIVAGRGRQALKVYCVTNELHSPTRFRMEPNEQIKIFMEMEEQGLELLAIYHSHPNGPEHPSPTDIEEFSYPGTIMLIWHPYSQGWKCSAYRIEDRIVSEVDWRIIG